MKTTPKDFFLNLGAIVGLYITAVSVINLAFTLINVAFPPSLYDTYSYSSSASISWPVATLIIVFPVFVLLFWLLEKDYRAMPEKRELGVRKWLSFITLFFAGIAIAGDLIFLLYTFLTGEILTTGFLLKVLSVFIVTVAIFSFYILDLRGKMTSGGRKMYTIASLVAIVVLIVIGFVIVGSPYTQRAIRDDNQRVNDLQFIQGQIVSFWQQKNQILPATLADLEYPISGFVNPKDPKTGQMYEYRSLGGRKFELCATFALPSRNPNSKLFLARSYGIIENENWQHGVGRTCFERTIDPELSRPYVPGSPIKN